MLGSTARRFILAILKLGWLLLKLLSYSDQAKTREDNGGTEKAASHEIETEKLRYMEY